MSAERKIVEDKLTDEKLKRDKDALPLEELTLAEVGMDIPYEWAAAKRWLPTDRINTFKRVMLDGTPHLQFILSDAINHGFYDYASALIRTYNRKDKIGLDPNRYGVYKYKDEFSSTTPIVQILFLYRAKPNASLGLLINELIQAGTFLSYVSAEAYYKINLPKWGLTHIKPFLMPADYILHVALWKKDFGEWTTPILYTNDPHPKQFFVCMQFLTEDLISDRPEVQTKEAYKKLLGQETTYHTNLFNLICDYIPFDNRLKLEETTEYFNDVKDPKCKQVFFEKFKMILMRHYEEYRMEQMKLQKAEKERREKEEKEIQEQAMARLPSEMRSLKAMVAKQSDLIIQQSKTIQQLKDMNKQQQDMSRKQGEQFSQFMSMFQQFMMKDRAGSAAEVLSAIPGTGNILEDFEIELDGASGKVKAKEKSKNSNT